MKKLLLIVSLAFILFSCSKNEGKTTPLELSGFSHEKSLPLEYAKMYGIDEYSYETSSKEKKNCYLISVSDSDYYLAIHKDYEFPQNLPEKIKVLRYPVENTYLCASSAMALWDCLDSLDSIAFSAFQEKDWYVKGAENAMKEGKILYAGKYNAPDFELLLDKKCAFVIESTMIYHAPQIKEKFEQLSIPVFVDKSSYEDHPLGRVEWVKIYALLSGKLSAGENFFNEQVDKIKSIEFEADLKNQKKIAFFYVTSGGMVVVRGKEDYISKMIEISGGKYASSFLSKKKSSPSVTISMEKFYAECGDSDILIYNSSIYNTLQSREDLIEKSPVFEDFKAVKSGNVWCTGKNLYQATDHIGDMIIDLHSIIMGEEGKLNFLEKVE